MDSENDGAIWRAFLLALSVLAITVGVAACGAPVINSSGLSWDNSLWANREAQRTERERIQANRDIRIEAQRSETMQAFLEVAGKALIVGAIVFGLAKALPPMVASLAAAFAAWAARPHRPVAPPPQIIVMAAPYLEAMRGGRLEYDPADGWMVVSDATQTVKLLEDKRHP